MMCAPTPQTSLVKSWCRTRLDIHRVSFWWTIENFAQRPEKEGEFITSSTFIAPTSNNPRWFLRAYPKGSDREESGYFSLYLNSEGCEKEVRAKYRISLLSSTDQELKAFENCNSFTSGSRSAWGWRQYIKRCDLLDPRMGYLVGGHLRIFCGISYEGETYNRSGFIDTATSITPPDCSLGEDLGNLFRSQTSGDIVVSCDDHTFLAHRDILTARSQVFAAMLGANMKENNENKVNITDIKSEVVKEMLFYLYSGRAPENLDDIAQELLIAADKYDLKRLKVLCEQSICYSLNVTTVKEMLIFADQYSADHLKRFAVHFICDNFGDIGKTENWKALKRSHPYLSNKVLNSLLKQRVLKRHSELSGAGGSAAK